MTESRDPRTLRCQSRVGQLLRQKWRLDGLLGVGGMASVYAATHRNKKRGAVKILHPELGVNDDARERFLREGYVANHVEHPGAVSVLDDDIAEDGSVFLVMELLEGQTIDRIAQGRAGERLEIGEVLAIADDLLDVLAAAHDKGIVHRDLKPENLFLTNRGELKVLDFGIARLREVAGSGSTTTMGSAMGTPAFMPPEQASGRWDAVDGRSDLWAVGATMFNLLTGRYVHQAETVQLLMLAAMTQPAPPLVRFAHAPPEVSAVVDRALAFDPQARWPDARAMQRAVRDARARCTTSMKPPLAIAPATLVSPRSAASDPVLGHDAARPMVDAATGSPVSRDRTEPRVPIRVSRALLAAGALAILAAFLAWIGFSSLLRHSNAADPVPPREPLPPATQVAAPSVARDDAPTSQTVEPPSPPDKGTAGPASSARLRGDKVTSPRPAHTAAPAKTLSPSAQPADKSIFDGRQ